MRPARFSALLIPALLGMFSLAHGFDFQSPNDILSQINSGPNKPPAGDQIDPNYKPPPPPDFSQYSGIADNNQGLISGLMDKLKKTKQPTADDTPEGMHKQNTRPTSGAGTITKLFGKNVTGSANFDGDSHMRMYYLQTILFGFIKIKTGYPTTVTEKAPPRVRDLFNKIGKDADKGGFLDGSSLVTYMMLGKIVEGYDNKYYMVIEDLLPPNLYKQRYDAQGNVIGSVPGDEKTDQDLKNDAANQKAAVQKEYDQKKQAEIDQRHNEKVKADNNFTNADTALNQAKADDKTAHDTVDSLKDQISKTTDDKQKAILQKQLDDANSKAGDADKNLTTAQNNFNAAKDAKDKADKADQLGQDYLAAKTNYDKLQAAADQAKLDIGKANGPDDLKAKQDASKAAQDKADAAKQKMDNLAQQVQNTNT